MADFKILVTSQKGGVGKSTISANLAAYLCKHNHTTALLDYDLHGSSSKWLNGAPKIGVHIQHSPLPLEIGGNRPVHEARQKLKRLCYTNEVVVADLTWTDSISAEFLFEFDLVIVPTSVSEIELNATAEFLDRLSWVFQSTIHKPPKLLLCPTRVSYEQMADDSIFKQYFPVSLMLAPAVLEGHSAKQLYKRGYIHDLNDACGSSFCEFGNAVISVIAQHKQTHSTPTSTSNLRMKALLQMAARYESKMDSALSNFFHQN
jgi:hypothetical protein